MRFLEVFFTLNAARRLDVRARKFDLEINGTIKDLGEMPYRILHAISQNRYDDAIHVMRSHQQEHNSYPLYVEKVGKLFDHCEELIKAIKAKKTFPGLSSLPQNNQEEIHQKCLENWDELKLTLRRIRSF